MAVRRNWRQAPQPAAAAMDNGTNRVAPPTRDRHWITGDPYQRRESGWAQWMQTSCRQEGISKQQTPLHFNPQDVAMEPRMGHAL